LLWENYSKYLFEGPVPGNIMSQILRAVSQFKTVTGVPMERVRVVVEPE
jgi:hypothetical protein